MRRSPRIVAAAVVAALPLAACSLLVETGDLGGGSAGAFDAAREVGSGDGALTDASASDSSIDSGEGTFPGCVDGPGRFCSSFDEPDPEARWSRSYEQRGQVSFDGVGLSAPNAMHARVVAGAGSGAADLMKDLPANVTRVRCELDMKLESVPSGTNTGLDVLSLITTVPGGPTHSVYMASFDGSWYLAEFRPAPVGLDRSTELGALPKGKWLHVALDTSMTFATLTIEGKSVTLDNLTVPGGSGRTVHLGVSFASPTVDTASLLVDNVDCTFSAN